MIELFARYVGIFVFLLPATGVVGFGDIQFTDVRHGKYVRGSIIRTVETGDLLKCFQYCVLQSDCFSVNINKSKQKCNLLKFPIVDDDCISNLIPASDWVYYGENKVSIIYKDTNS